MSRPAPRVLCLGELVVDFVSLEPGTALEDARRFEKHVGGSAANVAAGLHHHGLDARLWTKVGRDPLGAFARREAIRLGLPAEGILEDDAHPTRFLLLGTGAAGETLVDVHHQESAHLYLGPGDLPLDRLGEIAGVHVAGTALLGPGIASTTTALLERARAEACYVSFDPNVRLDRARDADGVRRTFLEVVASAHLLQVTMPNWRFLFGDQPPQEVLAAYGLDLVAVTDGARGVTLATRAAVVFVPAPETRVADPTGAGDAFLAALLARVYRLSHLHAVTPLEASELASWGAEAARWAGRVLRHRGATTAYDVARRRLASPPPGRGGRAGRDDRS